MPHLRHRPANRPFPWPDTPSAIRRAVVAAGLVLMLAACDLGAGRAPRPAADAARDRSLTVAARDGYLPPGLPERIKAELGLDVRVIVPGGDAETLAAITGRSAGAGAAAADGGVDVALVPGEHAQALGDAGLLEPLRPDRIPNLANLYPEAAWLPHDRGIRFSVPYTWGTTGLCYRDDLAKRPPESWTDLLDPPDWARGRVTMFTTERGLALPALKALGHSLNTTDDRHLASAADALLRARRTLLAYDDTTFADRLRTGEAIMAQSRDGACPATEPGIRFTVPREGGDLWTETLVIARDSRHKEAAHALIDHLLAPDAHAWVAMNTGYKVPNAPAMERVLAQSAKVEPQLRMTPADLLLGEPLVDLGAAAGKYARLSARVAQG